MLHRGILAVLLLLCCCLGAYAKASISAAELAHLNLYKVLGVDSKATSTVIAKAYRKLAIKYHPDKNPKGHDQFIRIAYAYEILGDDDKRAHYDASRFDPNFMPQPAPDWDTWQPPPPPTTTVFEEWGQHNIYVDLLMLLLLGIATWGAWMGLIWWNAYRRAAAKAAAKAKAAASVPAPRPAGPSARARQRQAAAANASSSSEEEEGGEEQQAGQAGGEAPKGRSLLEAAARPAPTASSSEWSSEELRLLDKALKRFPVGTIKRWEAVASVVRTRTVEEVVSMVKTHKGAALRHKEMEDWKAGRKPLKVPVTNATPDIRDGDGMVAVVASANGAGSGSGSGSGAGVGAGAGAADAAANGGAGAKKAAGKAGAKGEDAPWSAEEEAALVAALKTHRKAKDAAADAGAEAVAAAADAEKQRWKAIAALVPGRTPAQCIRRYKLLKEAWKAKKGEAAGGDAGGDAE